MSYIYYRISKFYKEIIGETDPRIYSFFVICTVQTLYVIGILNIWLDYIGKSDKILSPLEMGIIFIGFLLINVITLLKNGIKQNELELDWEADSVMKRELKGGLVVLFLVSAPILFGISVIWF